MLGKYYIRDTLSLPKKLLSMFFFNGKKYNYWVIYNRIAHFFPLGVSNDDAADFYDSYPGREEFKKIMSLAIYDETNFKKIWDPFITSIERATGKNIIGMTNGINPCYSGFIPLKSDSTESLSRFSEIHFFVSLLGPFYSVVGVDRNELVVNGQMIRSVNYITVSPEGVFEKDFLSLINCIEGSFTGYKFVPFAICEQIIPGLYLEYVHVPPATIFHALFNANINLTATAIGNKLFLADQWEKPLA